MVGSSLLHNDPTVHEDDLVSHIAGKGHFVSHDDHGHLVFGQFLDNLEHFAGEFRVQRRGRLVEEKNLRVHRERAGNGHALLLTTAKLAGISLLLAFEAHALEQSTANVPRFLAGISKHAHRSEAKVLKHRQVRKRPNSFSISLFYSKQSDISSYYRNNALYNSLGYGYGYGYGYGTLNSLAYNYDSMLDDDKNIRMFGATIGWGKRLRWPDDYFQFMATIGYTRYMLRDWNYFYIANGNCNNLNLGLQLSRTSTDNQLFPRRGSEFLLSLTVTPPWSLFDGKDYRNLALNSNSATYESELQDMYRWIEYHKWKFKSRTYTALTSAQKCFVLMTRIELGILGSFNSDKKSPFETFYVGGDGMSGYSYSYAEETIGMRGYDNGSISTSSAYTESSGRRTSNNAYAYDRFTLELRYPFMLGNTTIYGLGFLEGGNAWADIKKFNPFNMKRSAGVGVRIFLPMVGLMGIDWAYGFDKVYGSGGWSKGGSNFHFVLGQEF